MKISDKKQLVKLVSYMTMGDGGLYQAKGCRYPSFAMNMVETNLDYIEFCKGVLENITSVRMTYVNKEGNRRNQYRIQSRTHPFFKPIRERVYTDKYKGIDPHALKLLDWEALAILYMCDGSLYTEMPKPHKRLKNPSHNVTLNLKRLSYGDLFILKKALKRYLDLEFNINRQNQYYYLRLRTKDVDKFMEGIKSYTFPSFKYKLTESFRTNSPQMG